MPVTFAERVEKFRRQGVSASDAQRLANIERLSEAVERDRKRLADIDRVLPTLDERDRARLAVQRSLIAQFMAEDEQQLRMYRRGEL